MSNLETQTYIRLHINLRAIIIRKPISNRQRIISHLVSRNTTHLSGTMTRELRTQRVYRWTFLDISESQDYNILDSITIASSQGSLQGRSTPIRKLAMKP
jgi:hypothetical protein